MSQYKDAFRHHNDGQIDSPQAAVSSLVLFLLNSPQLHLVDSSCVVKQIDSFMADLLAAIQAKPRYSVRTQAAFARSFKFLNAGRTGVSEKFLGFNVRTLSRLHDMSPPVYVCAMALLDSGVQDDPETIRNTQDFRNLIDRLGLQSSSPTRSVQNSRKASLILLEVFLYMVIIHRAQAAEEADKAANRAAIQEYEELIV